MKTVRNFVARFFFVVLFTIIYSLAPSQAAMKNDTPNEPARDDAGRGISLRVLWTVSGYLPGKKPVWGEKEAKTLLFKPLDITSTSISFDGQVCRDVSFTVDEVAAGPYLHDQLEVTPEDLQLTDETIQVIRTNCHLPGFDEYVRLPDRRLLVPMHGFVFIFEPVVDY